MLEFSFLFAEVPLFGTFEYLLLAAYFAALLAIGARFYRRDSRLAEYFAGSRSMSWLPVSISILASDTSAITILGNPGYAFARDLSIFWYAASYSVAAWLIIAIFLPFYCRLRLYSAYEYLERRFDVRVRTLTSFLFLFVRGAHVAIAIYAPATLLSQITGLSKPGAILLMGCITVAYTTLGGIRAVIWTDVLQFSIVFGGIAVVFFETTARVQGGLAAVWQIGAEAGKWRIVDLSPGLNVETALWPTLLGGTVMALATLGTDQAVLQRYFTAKAESECARSLRAVSVLVLPTNLVLLALGVFLFAFYQQNPALRAALPGPDDVLGHFTRLELPRSVAALLVGGVFAASMGVMSAGINSLATCTVVDFHQRLFRPGASDRECVVAARVATIAWGAVTTVGALYAGKLGTLATAFAKIQGYVGGVMLGLFLLAIFSRRASGAGALAGAAAGMALVTWVAFGTNVGLFWYGTVGAGATIAVGEAVSRFLGAPLRARSDYQEIRKIEVQA